MKQLTKIIGISFLAFGLAACGGSSNGGSRAGGAGGGSSSAGNSGTSVANRTGEANYVGTFNATATPQGGVVSGGKVYKGGSFTGNVRAEADFDKDQIDVDLIGTRKANVIDSYKAEFDDIAIKNGKFSGQGREDILANGGSLRSTNGKAKIDGSFSADGRKITGKTASVGSLVNVETDFSASER